MGMIRKTPSTRERLTGLPYEPFGIQRLEDVRTRTFPTINKSNKGVGKDRLCLAFIEGSTSRPLIEGVQFPISLRIVHCVILRIHANSEHRYEVLNI
ncbi:hypothetical protein JTB14_027497 [Gonioctena quinquepunctata]|nr:hypothetical protein JTB14_027497 [Gonioctena quinquepunctata]